MKAKEQQSAVEWLIGYINHLNENGYDFRPKYDENIVEQAKEMEFEQRKKDFVNGYKSRAKESNLIFDETSEMYAIKLFNETFKSE
jgi:coproporphyrinogen III oxidase